MEDRLAVISCIISNPGSVATVNEKFHLQSGLIIARLGVPCRDYGDHFLERRAVAGKLDDRKTL